MKIEEWLKEQRDELQAFQEYWKSQINNPYHPEEMEPEEWNEQFGVWLHVNDGWEGLE